MPLIFRNNSGLGENFSDLNDLLSKISDTLTSAGWTCTTASSVLTAACDTAPYYFRLSTATANTLSVTASLDSNFTDGNISPAVSFSTNSNKLWMLADETMFIVWLNDNNKGFLYAGALDKESSTDNFAWGIGFISVGFSGYYTFPDSDNQRFFLAKTYDGSSKWPWAPGSNLDTIYFEGTASKDTGGVTGFTFPIKEDANKHRGNLRYVLSGVSKAPTLRVISLSADSLAYSLNPDPDLSADKLITADQLSTYPKWNNYVGNYIVATPNTVAAAFKISN